VYEWRNKRLGDDLLVLTCLSEGYEGGNKKGWKKGEISPENGGWLDEGKKKKEKRKKKKKNDDNAGTRQCAMQVQYRITS
jgi:hypothetical protein